GSLLAQGRHRRVRRLCAARAARGRHARYAPAHRALPAGLESPLHRRGGDMKRHALAAAAVVVAIAGCAQMRMPGMGWETLVDGDKGLDNFTRVGEANWRTEDGAIVADKGKGGYLVSKNDYKDFEIRAEFWAATDTNSGVLIRCTDPAKNVAATCYEVNNR